MLLGHMTRQVAEDSCLWAAGGTDEEGKRKYRLLDIFGDWCDQVTDLIRWVCHIHS